MLTAPDFKRLLIRALEKRRLELLEGLARGVEMREYRKTIGRLAELDESKNLIETTFKKGVTDDDED